MGCDVLQGSIIRSWRRRWFLLTGTSFSYFADDSMSLLKRTLPLWRVTKVGSCGWHDAPRVERTFT